MTVEKYEIILSGQPSNQTLPLGKGWNVRYQVKNPKFPITFTVYSSLNGGSWKTENSQTYVDTSQNCYTDTEGNVYISNNFGSDASNTEVGNTKVKCTITSGGQTLYTDVVTFTRAIYYVSLTNPSSSGKTVQSGENFTIEGTISPFFEDSKKINVTFRNTSSGGVTGMQSFTIPSMLNPPPNTYNRSFSEIIKAPTTVGATYNIEFAVDKYSSNTSYSTRTITISS